MAEKTPCISCLQAYGHISLLNEAAMKNNVPSYQCLIDIVCGACVCSCVPSSLTQPSPIVNPHHNNSGLPHGRMHTAQRWSRTCVVLLMLSYQLHASQVVCCLHSPACMLLLSLAEDVECDTKLKRNLTALHFTF